MLLEASDQSATARGKSGTKPREHARLAPQALQDVRLFRKADEQRSEIRRTLSLEHSRGARRSNRGLEFLGRAESDFLARLDLNLLAGGRVATNASCTIPHL